MAMFNSYVKLPEGNSNIDGLNMLEPMGLVIWETAENHVMKWMMELLDPFPLAQSLFIAADTELVPRRQVKMGGLTTPNSPPLTACSNQAEKIGIFWRDLFSHFWRWLPLGLPDESWLVNFPLDFIQMAPRTPVYAHPSPKTHATKLHLIPQAWNTPLLGYYVTMWHFFPLPTIFVELWVLLISSLTKYPHIMHGFVIAPVFQGQIQIILYPAMSVCLMVKNHLPCYFWSPKPETKVPVWLCFAMFLS